MKLWNLALALCLGLTITIGGANLASAANLSYPGDCKDKILRSAAKKNGCSIESGAKHHKVIKNGQQVTLIPNSVKPNNTCRSIIKALNANC